MKPSSITRVAGPQSRCKFSLRWTDITPPAGIYHRMWGAAKHERATGVHRPLRATATMFAAFNDCAGGRQTILALDHCVMGATEHNELLTRIAEISGEPPDAILVVFSHTHSAGLMGLDRVENPGGDLIPGYLRELAERSGQLVKECRLALQEAVLVYGTGRCQLAAHRDFWDEQRRQFVCGTNPGGPSDDTVIVARVSAPDGCLLASVVNYACHPTTLAWDNSLISPDYVGALRDLVERETGAPCLFLQGASGELGPWEGFVGDPAVADRNGRELGYAALAALTGLPPAGKAFCYQGPVVSGATLGAWAYQTFDADELTRQETFQRVRWDEPLHYRAGRPSAEQTEAEWKQCLAQETEARAAGETSQAEDFRALAERKNRLLTRLRQLPKGDTFPLQVVILKIGGGVWIGVQGEAYSLLQTALRRKFPTHAIVLATIAADWGASYLPPRELYDTGIYQETIAVVAAGSLEQLIESISAHLS